MKEILFVQYPKCGTCQKAKKWLIENKILFQDRNITEQNPSKGELSTWYEKSGLPINKFFNTSGKIYKENNLKEKVKTSSDDELLDILASNGMVVKRPIVIADNFVLVGFNETEWIEKLQKQ